MNPQCPKKTCSGVRRHNIVTDQIQCDRCGDAYNLSDWLQEKETKEKKTPQEYV